MNSGQKPALSAIIWTLALFCVPTHVSAQRTLDVAIGTNKNIWEVFDSIISFLALSIGSVSIALFVVGAFMITISGAKEDARQNGKNLIIGSLLSLAVVTGAYAILRTVDCFLTPSC